MVSFSLAISQEAMALAKAGVQRLTPRERQVLQLILSGQSNKQVARTLLISHRTVEVHRGRVMDKLGTKNGMELAGIIAAISDRPPILSTDQ